MNLKNNKLVLSALEKDFSRRYIATGKIQSDGRLNLNKACINLLQPNDGDEFYLINDSSSVILVRKPLDGDEKKVIATAKWEKSKGRLRVSPNAMRLIMACKVGFQVFNYNDDIAIQIEPYIEPPQGLSDLDIYSVSDLSKYILRSSRSLFHLDIVSLYQEVSDLNFRILGEYWVNSFYQDLLDETQTWKPLNKSDSNKDVVLTKYWLPIIAYEKGHYARPGVISFNEKSLDAFSEIIKECKEWSRNNKEKAQYHKSGIVEFTGSKLFKLSNIINNVTIQDISNLYPKYKCLSVEEKGLMKLALPEIDSYIKKYKI